MFGMGWVTRFEVNMLLAVCWFLIDMSFWNYLVIWISRKVMEVLLLPCSCVGFGGCLGWSQCYRLSHPKLLNSHLNTSSTL